MRRTIVLSGAGGLIGSALREFLIQQGDSVLHLVRSAERVDATHVFWSPESGEIDRERLQGIDAVIHLAGEPIGGVWTSAKRQRILDSRVQGTRLLSHTLAEMDAPPGVLITASATGYYGDRGSEWLQETSTAGSGFLANVCRQWEAAAQPAADAGIRCVQTRFGLVLTPFGGLLGKILPIFRRGLGGTLGDGSNYMSWIALGDLLRALVFLLDAGQVHGPVNLVAPEPITNREFTRALAAAVHRPAFFHLPAFLLRLLMGQMAKEMLLSSARVRPNRLLQSGFQFHGSTLEQVLSNFIAAG